MTHRHHRRVSIIRKRVRRRIPRSLHPHSSRHRQQANPRDKPQERTARTTPTVRSRRDWITGSVAIMMHAKADNRAQFAHKRRIVLSKMSWIHRMPSAADHHVVIQELEQTKYRSESVNGEYSVHFFFKSIQSVSTALVKQIFTQRYICLSFSFL